MSIDCAALVIQVWRDAVTKFSDPGVTPAAHPCIEVPSKQNMPLRCSYSELVSEGSKPDLS